MFRTISRLVGRASTRFVLIVYWGCLESVLFVMHLNYAVFASISFALWRAGQCREMPIYNK